ncbi:Histone acetyltransferase of the MYST family [Seminavis robusta]|uniref:Histone acetyltransferase n=1 Tax=Seminavis robusta TaxID=568900 RepID=A0A9N8DNL0_9STRA|nr:Histone acetyltransferase of the MYST family [Seminavis robusta]|eukprot:Sro245_g097500.1 Histone acetyltransferase of the MYST family (457) ;mRNA; f:62533-64121
MAETKAEPATEETAEVGLKKPLEIGDHCNVRWRDGEQVLMARVVERRPLLEGSRKRRKGSAATATAVDIETLKPEEVEYYVHYTEHDRRLDEWIKLDKFLLETLQRAEDMMKKRTSNEDENNKPRPSRRRSTSQTTNKSGDGASLSLTGGNWPVGHSGDPSLKQLEEEHEEATKVKNIASIVMGAWEVEAWYYSPYPEEYSQESTVLYVCEYCLKYMRKAKTLKKHKAECTWRRPPGTEIYREDKLSVFEVDGKENRVYCQNLCLLAKLFLDHKTLYYDVEPFLFYIITSVDDKGAHIVGYFSKEKVSAEEYNLACILTFPQYQSQGFGKFIISLSYELSKREMKQGSPEKPLSDLGKISYRSYWKHILLHLLGDHDTSKDLSVKEISVQTGIKTEDIISTLQSLDMIKVWKGQHVVYVKQDTINAYLKQKKKLRLCKPECLSWQPPPEKDKKVTK